MSNFQKLKLKKIAKQYVWDEPYLWKYGADQIIRRCVPNSEFQSTLSFCHSYACGGHFGSKLPLSKSLRVVFIGLPSLRMHVLFVNLVINVNERAI